MAAVDGDRARAAAVMEGAEPERPAGDGSKIRAAAANGGTAAVDGDGARVAAATVDGGGGNVKQVWLATLLWPTNYKPHL
ncbi:hypothetical protein OsI_17883 [Oryza sativa Indica Group]|uniref:Uncharacterized protein n=1 Tax=Oryza sativa subsp. indica TaxID=39946 RepID=B8ARE8_ORYSI|nr:hypothetical protein OsI_17883 [Oryza sativa Indica Group]